MITTRAHYPSRLPLRLMLALLVAMAMLVTAIPLAQRVLATNGGLVLSEYVNGTGGNKALEIYNGTGAPISLTSTSVQFMFDDGSSTIIVLPSAASLAAGAVWVIAHPDIAVGVGADQTHAGPWFDGDDLVALVRFGTGVDRIGSLEEAGPWGSGSTSTVDNTLRRKATATTGDSNFFDPFDPALEWVGAGLNVLDGLGCWGETACATSDPPGDDPPDDDPHADAAAALAALQAQVADLAATGALDDAAALRLLERLDRVASRLEAGQHGSAYGQLTAFAAGLNGVVRRGLLDPTAADVLRDGAAAVIALLTG